MPTDPRHPDLLAAKSRHLADAQDKQAVEVDAGVGRRIDQPVETGVEVEGVAKRDNERAVELADGDGHTDPADTGQGGGPGGVVDPTTGAVTPGPVVTPGGGLGSPIEPDQGVAVTERDLDNIELLAGGSPAAGAQCAASSQLRP